MNSKIANCIIDIANKLDDDGYYKISDKLNDIIVRIAAGPSNDPWAQHNWMGQPKAIGDVATSWWQRFIDLPPGTGPFEDESGAFDMFPYKLPQMSNDPAIYKKQVEQIYNRMSPGMGKLSKMMGGQMEAYLSQMVGPELAQQTIQHLKTQPPDYQYRYLNQLVGSKLAPVFMEALSGGSSGQSYNGGYSQPYQNYQSGGWYQPNQTNQQYLSDSGPVSGGSIFRTKSDDEFGKNLKGYNTP
jgi:hypothetical protein